jgi:hypothetical protein
VNWKPTIKPSRNPSRVKLGDAKSWFSAQRLIDVYTGKKALLLSSDNVKDSASRNHSTMGMDDRRCHTTWSWLVCSSGEHHGRMDMT